MWHGVRMSFIFFFSNHVYGGDRRTACNAPRLFKKHQKSIEKQWHHHPSPLWLSEKKRKISSAGIGREDISNENNGQPLETDWTGMRRKQW